MKNLLIIAYDFPPYAGSGIYRTLAWVRLLAQRDWDVTVVTVKNPEPPLDNDLLKKVPPSVKILRASYMNPLEILGKLKKPKKSNQSTSQPVNQSTSIKDWLTWWLHIPDNRICWLPFGLFRAMKAIKKQKISIIYSTSPYMTAHLIAGLIKKFTGLPWVADFRDPWRANPFRNIPYQSINHWDSFLEAWVMRQADHIICVTEYMKKDFINRYPLIKNKISYIPNGYDPEDYENLKPLRKFDKDYFVLTHAGTFYGPRSPIPLLKAMYVFQQQYPKLTKKFCLQLIGHPSYDGKLLQDIAHQFKVTDMVKIISTIPRTKALGYLKGSDSLLMVGFKGKNDEIQVSGKFYEYLAVAKPILILAPQKSDVAEIFHSINAPGEICDPDDISSIIANIKNLIKNKDKYQASSQIEKFNRHNLIIQLETILSSVLRH